MSSRLPTRWHIHGTRGCQNSFVGTAANLCTLEGTYEVEEAVAEIPVAPKVALYPPVAISGCKTTTQHVRISRFPEHFFERTQIVHISALINHTRCPLPGASLQDPHRVIRHATISIQRVSGGGCMLLFLIYLGAPCVSVTYNHTNHLAQQTPTTSHAPG
jgi:hypothetical protein